MMKNILYSYNIKFSRFHFFAVNISFFLLLLIGSSCTKSKLNTAGNIKKDSITVPIENEGDSGRVGDVVGKVTVGYQGWFAGNTDSSPINIIPNTHRWWHWGGDTTPSFEIWPDTREYNKTYITSYGNLGNGSPSVLFSSYDDQTVDTHFKWMHQYGIDCAALQRFGGDFGDYVFKAQRDSILAKVKRNAEKNNVKFYVMYDISGWTNFKSEIKTDWTNTVTGYLNTLSSSAYAKQDGKPIVCIWGIGNKSLGSAADYTEVINWFKQQGCYVIAGVASGSWRTDDTAMYHALISANMVSPWTVGGYKYNVEIDDYYKNKVAIDLDSCKSHNVDFQPVIFPGFSWHNLHNGPVNEFPRNHGEFMWYQFCKVRENNIPSVYVAMFDEYDEGTAIAKSAEDASMAPTGHYFLTLDVDGVHVSSDFYLRLTHDGGDMIKGLTPLNWSVTTPFQ